jgi:bifunctional non-homologous end joining protein LigD
MRFALHYGFRLELDGVLVSWAVPKGPASTRPTSAWLCMSRTIPVLWFIRRTIPQNSTVPALYLVWDKGTWEPVGNLNKDLQRKAGLQPSWRGLNGQWELVKIAKAAEAGALAAVQEARCVRATAG